MRNCVVLPTQSLTSVFDPCVGFYDKKRMVISQDPAHRDSEPDLVFEDMTVMSDFELHCLCREEQVG